jgi:Ca2+-transporting ATPase
VFIIVWILNFLNSRNIIDSLLKALTLAMSILPEEIPVAFTTFMALGAFRLMKMGIIVKGMKTVETLGSATVICTDKTGTITENRMTLAGVYALINNKTFAINALDEAAKQVVRNAMWASEPAPFDPMEKALHEVYATSFYTDERPFFKMVHEYPLGGQPPMMTHIFEDENGNRIIAVKGAPEAIINHASLSDEEATKIHIALADFASKGYRVLGVGTSAFDGNNFPAEQESFPFKFSGLVAFYDPPKKNMRAVFDAFYKAGIKVKIITGDNTATTAAIAKETGFSGYDKTITGNELTTMNEMDLDNRIEGINIFARMYPEAKLKVINALKANQEIVAMTGDGVNDGPALKAAHIGIAMGSKGTEIAKQAASLILADDDLSKMVDAIAMGRKIYANLKKAIQYIISIHIPIILTVFIPLALGWVYPNIFSPVHIIFLELIMGPTCSIIYENEPAEKNTMLQKPRSFTTTFFNWNELVTSIIQGLMITAGVLLVYQYAVNSGLDENSTRTMVFVALISANIFQTFVNRSFFYSVWFTLRYKNALIPLITGATIVLTACMIYITPVAGLFKFSRLEAGNLTIGISGAFIFVMWYEIVKWVKRRKLIKN